ncbi:hypothetical protein [Streptomyces lavendulae]|uniref:hypothetical protein n=1 Tax=Streptomyces lavendulae TaxID=1914 RepID=UPI00340D8B24
MTADAYVCCTPLISPRWVSTRSLSRPSGCATLRPSPCPPHVVPRFQAFAARFDELLDEPVHLTRLREIPVG